jgi:uncharacterized protein with PhoU and TrkA domain
VTVEADSGFAGKPLSEALTGREDLVVLAVRQAGGQLEVGPPRSRILSAGEILIVVGQEEDLSRLGVSGGRRPAATRRRRGGLLGFLTR